MSGAFVFFLSAFIMFFACAIKWLKTFDFLAWISNYWKNLKGKMFLNVFRSIRITLDSAWGRQIEGCPFFLLNKCNIILTRFWPFNPPLQASDSGDPSFCIVEPRRPGTGGSAKWERLCMERASESLWRWCSGDHPQWNGWRYIMFLSRGTRINLLEFYFLFQLWSRRLKQTKCISFYIITVQQLFVQNKLFDLVCSWYLHQIWKVRKSWRRKESAASSPQTSRSTLLWCHVSGKRAISLVQREVSWQVNWCLRSRPFSLTQQSLRGSD